jgi:hypothetical protein
VPADIFVEYLIAIMLFPYVRFRNEAVRSQTPWDDMMDRAEWVWQVRMRREMRSLSTVYSLSVAMALLVASKGGCDVMAVFISR